ncbi:ankyrin repeat and SAM domain-containing protein 4B [Amia ocellicauda]|uniref:ankyrin repeat and SAM domain-containing protein 4B n=1 Tax=Amia ocellicauda TaxID=2972642 RepID=UPI0034649C7A
MSTRYHKAAIDGYLDLLKESTRKDLNSPDEDGMTPTLWAAFHGHVEALQLICSRGGDPDRSDIWGNTPLHHAASNGHLHILSFLVNFGANLFSMDNDFHTAMDVAASKDRMDCVRFLDEAASKQTIQNAKKVARLKEQAYREAEKRGKACERIKQRHQRKMSKMYDHRGSVSESGGSSFSGMGTINSVNEQFSKLIASDTSGSLTARFKGTLQKKFGKKDKNTIERQGDSNVIFVKQENGTAERPNFIEVFNEQEENEDEENEEEGGRRGTGQEGEEESKEGGSRAIKESIFNRPGLGNMVFRKNFSIKMGMELEDYPYSGETEDLGFRIRSELIQSEHQGEGDEGYDVSGDGELPWNEEEIGLDEEDEETSPLAAFLASISLVEFTPVFSREQLDLEALMLCSDEDLKGIRIQLGPRKKILEAAGRRKLALQQSRQISDSPL